MQTNLNAFEQLFGKQGEAKVESLESDKNFCTGIYQNGVFERRVTPLGYFVRQVTTNETLYLTQKCTPSFVMTLPKIPVGMLHAIHKFYAHVLSVIKSEVAAQIFWDTVDQKYLLNIPKQTVAGASISYKRDEGMWADKRYICAVNSHSHCAFNAFFSGTDTADEVNACTFLVLGNVNKDMPSIAFRAGCNGSFVNLNLSDVFDVLDTSTYEVSLDEMTKLTESKNVPATVSAGVPWYAKYLAQNNTGTKVVTTTAGGKKTRLFGNDFTDDQDYLRFMADGSHLYSSGRDTDYDQIISDWESDILEYEGMDVYTPLGFADKQSLKAFQDAFDLFAQSTLTNPDTSDVGMLLISDFVSLLDNLNYSPLEALKALYDEYDRMLKQDELNEFLSYVCMTVG